ncbi:MAG TPA: serine hydrolase [Ktedonobacteraceae bacterium]|jgi:CubicO group peptidase (beta-lactamase class C family)
MTQPVPASLYRERLHSYADFVHQIMQEWQVPGAAIAVVTDTEVLFSQGFGKRDVEQEVPVTEQTLFAIASCSKAFTAMGLAMLVDEGQLDWDTPVRHYFPSFKLFDSFASERLTPRDLLTHRSGLPDHTLAWYNSQISRQELVTRLQHFEPTHPLRTAWLYNNMMYTTAGYLLEILSGQSWENFTHQRILAPLGMTSTTCFPLEALRSAHIASPHKLTDGQLQKIKHYNYSKETATGPAGSIFSNLQDMSTWLQCLLHQSQYAENGQRLVSQARFKELIAPQMVMPPASDAIRSYPELSHSCYALGWWTFSYRGHTVVQHSGGIDGFSALTTFLPHDRLGIVVLTNREADLVPIHGILTHTACDHLLGLSELSWSERTRQEYQQIREQMEQRARTQEECVPAAPYSHSLSAYAGQFAHPGYGTFSLELDREQLIGTLNNLEYSFTHLHYDTFLAKLTNPAFQTRVTFQTDPQGTLTSFAFPIESEEHAIIFKRCT